MIRAEIPCWLPFFTVLICWRWNPEGELHMDVKACRPSWARVTQLCPKIICNKAIWKCDHQHNWRQQAGCLCSPGLTQPEASLLPQKENDSSSEMGDKRTLCLLPWFREGNSLFLSHLCTSTPGVKQGGGVSSLGWSPGTHWWQWHPATQQGCGQRTPGWPSPSLHP